MQVTSRIWGDGAAEELESTGVTEEDIIDLQVSWTARLLWSSIGPPNV